jgi:hypothetical protein
MRLRRKTIHPDMTVPVEKRRWLFILASARECGDLRIRHCELHDVDAEGVRELEQGAVEDTATMIFSLRVGQAYNTTGPSCYVRVE